MRSFAYTAALLLAGAAASPVLAQEAAPFTGPRVEGIIGYDKVDVNPGKDDSVMYGVAAGYDMQMGGLVVGIEGEYNDSNIKDCVGAGTAASPEVCARVGRDLYAGGRIGSAIGPDTLIYGKVGYTNAGFRATSNNGTGRVELADGNLDGVRVGAGLEQKVGPNSFVKAEYRYSNYEAGVERHQAVAGFGFRF